MPKAKPITIHGVEFASIGKAAKHYGLHIGTVKYRISKGMSYEDAVDIAPRCKKPISVNGVEFASMAEAAEQYNILEGTLYARVSRGMSYEDAVNTPLHAGVEVEVDGVVYPSVISACRQLGLDHHQVQSRRTRGFSDAEAFSRDRLPVRTKKALVVRGCHFSNFSEACAYFNVSTGCVKRRIKSGWPIEKAITIPVGEPLVKKRTKPVRNFGKVAMGNLEFNSISAMFEYYRVDRDIEQCRTHIIEGREPRRVLAYSMTRLRRAGQIDGHDRRVDEDTLPASCLPILISAAII